MRELLDDFNKKGIKVFVCNLQVNIYFVYDINNNNNNNKDLMPVLWSNDCTKILLKTGYTTIREASSFPL